MRSRKAGPTLQELRMPLPAGVVDADLDIVEKLKRCPNAMTMGNAAKLLGVSRTTIWRAVRDSRIPTVDLCLGENLIDTVLWIKRIEIKNPHLVEIRRLHARRYAA